MALCLSTKMPIKIPSKQKSRTWKFAGEYLLRKQFQTNQAHLGAGTGQKIETPIKLSSSTYTPCICSGHRPVYILCCK